MTACAIRVSNVSKAYRIWNSPGDRLKSILLHCLKHLVPIFRQRLAAEQGRLYRDFYALQNVSLDVGPGEAVGIIGRNGSGKSTLLQIIAGTLMPSDGVVEVNGRVAALLELGSGFNPEFTGRENVRLNASILGLSDAEIDQRFPAIEQFADIGDFIDQPVKIYSSGMLMRLAFAVQTHVSADIVIVDEALAVGDLRFVQKCMRHLRELLENGATLLFVTHDPATVRALCSRAVWIDSGVIRQIDVPPEVTRNYAQFMAYGDQSMSLATSAVDPVRGVESRGRETLKSVDPATPEARGAIERFGVLNLDTGTPCFSVESGEMVMIAMEVVARESLQMPNVSVHLNNRLDQTVVGLNPRCFAKEIGSLRPGERCSIQFVFEFPILLAGEYSLSLGFTDGTRENHQPIHIVHSFWQMKVAAKDPQQRNYMFGLSDVEVTVNRI